MNTTTNDPLFESPILCLQETMQNDLIENVFFEISLIKVYATTLKKATYLFVVQRCHGNHRLLCDFSSFIDAADDSLTHIPVYYYYQSHHIIKTGIYENLTICLHY